MSFAVGDYQATVLLATGASAQVWRGRRLATGAVVALKVFPADQLAAVRREAALAAAVDHPHVVTVLDVVADHDRVALVTEYAAGGDLADLLAGRGRLTPGQTLTVLIPLAAALATAHERQIVHGDISAGNIVFDQAGRPLLADLGAARAAMESGRAVQATPGDAAPELARAGVPTPATDLFSLGSVALACLTGRSAWPADDLRDVVIQAAAGQWPDLPDDAAPAPLVKAIRSLLEHDPDRRPGAATLVLDLRSAGRPEPLDIVVEGWDERPTATTASVSGPASAPGAVPRTAADLPVSRRRHGRNDEEEGAGESAAPRWVGTDSIHRGKWEPPSGRPDRPAAARARALTRTRSDAAAPRGGAQPDGGGRSGSTRLRARVRSASGRRSRRALRITALAAAAVVVAVVAGLVGLRWAASSQPSPIAVQQIPPLPDNTAGAAPHSANPPVTSGRQRPSTVGAPIRPATAPTGSSAAATQSSTGPARSRPTTRTATPPAVAPTTIAGSTTAAASTNAASTNAASSTVGTTATVPNPSATSSTAAAAVRATDWTRTVQALDRARSVALVSRNPAMLDAVYTRNSVARSADAQTIRALVAKGLRVSGAEHQVQSVQPITGAAGTVLVRDSLPSYQVLGATGSVVGRTPERAASRRVMVLVDTADGYRISEVRTP